MLNVHCVAHRLALASADAAKNVIEVQMFLETINTIFKYYEKSALRTAGFKDIQVSEYMPLFTHCDQGLTYLSSAS